MRIMGIDASPSCTGIAIYDTDINDFILVTKIRTSIKKATPTLGKRIEYIMIELSHLLFWNAVDVVIIEDIYVNKVSSAIPLAMTRGAIQETVYGLEYEELLTIASGTMKKAVTGKGNADKEKTYDCVKKHYEHSKIVQEALGEKLVSNNNAQKNEDMADACGLVYAYLTDPTLASPA